MRSLEALRDGEKLVHGGGNTLTVFTLVALVISIISVALTGAMYNVSIIINLLLGLAIGLPLTLAGRAKLRRAAHFLSEARHEPVPPLPDRPTGPVEQLTGIEADLHGLPGQGSVTEHTTLDLKGAERARPRRS